MQTNPLHALNLLGHRILGKIQSSKMTFGIKKRYINAFLIVGIAVIAELGNIASIFGLTFPNSYLITAGLVLFILSGFVNGILKYREYGRAFYDIDDPTIRNQTFKDMQLTSYHKQQGFKIYSTAHLGVREHYLMSVKTNSWLQGQPAISTVLARQHYSVPKVIRPLIPGIMYELLKRDTVLFNGNLVRLMVEPYHDRKHVHIQKARYFDLLCTNEISFRNFRSHHLLKTYFFGKSLLVDDNNTILPLEHSACANVIGSSTLVITSDNQILGSKQGNFARANTNRFVASGSGSVEWKDVKGTTSFLDVVIKAAEREFFEETNTSARVVHIQTKVIGYARILERGGNPDFFCVSRVDKPASYFTSKRMRFSESGIQVQANPLPFNKTANDLRGALHRFCEKEAAQEAISIQLWVFAQIFDQSNKLRKPP